MQERMYDARHEYERTPDIITFTDEELAQLQDTVEHGISSIYLYHGVPHNMRGGVLYPLNQLKDVYPDLYEQHKKKYDWRKEVMEESVPYLDCLWNDVIFLTAVNPKIIRRTLEDAGWTPPDGLNWRCYRIDPGTLDPSKTIISLRPHETLAKENCLRYDTEELRQCTMIPRETVEYYRRAIAKGERPLLYHRIPHILYKGTLSVDGLSVIDID